MLIYPSKRVAKMHFPIKMFAGGERKLALDLKLSRTTLRGILHGSGNPTLKTLEHLAEFKQLRLILLMAPEVPLRSEDSVVGASSLTLQDGFESWKIHFMNFVDSFRKTQDERLLMFPPLQILEARLRALLSSMVIHLCGECDLNPPHWALTPQPLKLPWFPSNMENLKATAILESPLSFRRNNIFVLKNFMDRV